MEGRVIEDQVLLCMPPRYPLRMLAGLEPGPQGAPLADPQLRGPE
jgi:hypothetical protein